MQNIFLFLARLHKRQIKYESERCQHEPKQKEEPYTGPSSIYDILVESNLGSNDPMDVFDGRYNNIRRFCTYNILKLKTC